MKDIVSVISDSASDPCLYTDLRRVGPSQTTSIKERRVHRTPGPALSCVDSLGPSGLQWSSTVDLFMNSEHGGKLRMFAL